MNIKELLAINGKWILFLVGIILGLLLSAILMSSNRDVNVIELDLKKIIHTYSVATAKSKTSLEEIHKDFKEKFNYAIDQIPAKTIVVNKGQLLSKHTSSDYTKHFIEIMGFNKIDDQKTN